MKTQTRKPKMDRGTNNMKKLQTRKKRCNAKKYEKKNGRYYIAINSEQ